MGQKMSENEKKMYKEMISQQLREIDEIIKNIDERIILVKNNIESLKEFKEAKEGDEILVNLVNGVFFKAKILEKEPLKVNVGANVMVEKSIDETIELLEENLKELNEQREELMRKGEELVVELQKLEQ